MNIINYLLNLRQELKNLYKRTDVYLLPVLKFLLGFAVFYFINANTGYMDVLNSIFVVIILSLVCAIIPLGGTVVIGMALIVMHSFGIGVEIGFFALCLYLILIILFLRFVPHDSIAILLTPLAFAINIPCVIPVGLGITKKASAALTSVCSVISYFYIRQMPMAAELKQAGELSGLEQLKELMNMMTGNSELLLYIITFTVVTLVVYLIRKLLTVYGWLTSILAGTGLYIFLIGLGSVFLDLDIDFIMLIAGGAGAAAVALVISFFLFSVNYKGSRYLQFEDDDYYYYVKAIPKNKPVNYEDEETDEAIDYFDTEDRSDIKSGSQDR
jgi:hypothetical protein